MMRMEDVANESLEALHGEEYGVKFLFQSDILYTNSVIIVSFLAMVIALEVFFEESTLHNLEKWVPKSIILIVVGLIIGVLCYFVVGPNFFHNMFGPKVFFDYLLPPIILDATYQLYSREFFLQIDAILLLAVIGTTLNILAIGGSLYVISGMGLFAGLSLIDCFIFGSIVAAVDPVAVLAVFAELGVQKSLTILILGESLFNDGVTVVVFDTLLQAAKYKLSTSTYFFIGLSFFTTSLGGMFIGYVLGCFSALLCKFTSHSTKMVEMPIVLGLAYLSYLNAHMFHWSGIMAIIGCGLAQKRYAFPNLFRKSHKTLESATMVLAHTADTIIFLLFGLNIYRLKDIDLLFMLWTIVFCTMYRILFVGLLGSFINIGRENHRLTFKHMFIMCYGGLRGAVSYLMAVNVDTESSKMILSGTMAIILFTCFLQGGTVEIWVKVFSFEEPEQHPTFLLLAMEKVSNHVLAGMSAVLGGSGSKLLAYAEILDYYDRKYIQPVLCWKGADDDESLKELEEKRDATVLDLYKDPRLLGVLKYAQEMIGDKTADKRMSKAQKIRDLNRMKKMVADELKYEEVDPLDKNQDWKHKVEYYNIMKKSEGYQR